MAEFQSGRYGTAYIGANELAITGWTFSPTTEVQRFRNSKTAGGTIKEPTFTDGNGTITLDFDFDDNVFAAPNSVRVGEFLTDVKLYLREDASLTTEPYWQFDSILVTGTPQSVAVDGRIETTINFEANGAIAYPGEGS